MSKYQVMRQKGIKEKRRNNVFFLCAIILLTLLIVIGGSYAFLSLTLFSEKKVEVTTGVLATSFKDGNAITLENAYPMSDSRGMMTSPYEFEIENTGDIKAKYDIILEEDKERNTLDKQYIKYSLKGKDGEWSEPSYLTSFVLEKGIEINPSEKNVYALRLWIDEKVGNEAQGKEFRARIVIYTVQSSGTTGDITPPMIHLAGNLSMNVEENDTFHDPGVERVTDDKDTLEKNDVKVSYEYYDGETTKEVENIDTSKRGVYYIYYKISDQSGNEGVSVRSINVYKKDTEPPVIRLKGEGVTGIEKEKDYIELGAEAEKNGEDLTSRIVVVGTVNTKRIGTYPIKYLVTDSNGNTSSIVRIVNVLSMSLDKEEIILDLSNNPTERIGFSGENLGELTYTSNDESIATVDSNGNVTGKRIGETTVTITSTKGLHKTVKVKVQKTIEITYIKQGTGVSSIGKEKDHCVITSGDSCSVEAPSITIGSGYTAVGWSTSSTATTGTSVGEKITLSSNETYYSISYKNAITYTVHFNANGNTVSATSKSCTIPAAYNSNTQATSCDITTPTITAPSATPTVIGFNQSASATTSQVGSNTTLSVTSSINGKTYYALTKKDAKTITITFNKNGASTQTNSSGTAVSDATVTRTCTIAATYNGTAQATTCNVTSPTIVGSSNTPTVIGYSTAASTHTSSWNHNTSKAVSANATYYAQTTKAAKTITITFNRNGAASQTNSSGTAVSDATVTRSCTIATTYNGVSQATTCNVTSPTIVGSSNTPTVIGYSTAASTHTSSWNHNTSKAVSANTTYYAQTKKAAITRSITYKKQGTGVSAVGKTSDSCTIAETYNGVAQGTSCNVVAPSITVVSGYTAVGWNASSSATTGTGVGKTITLSGNATYYSISYKNAITYSVTFNANKSTINATSKSCTIPAAYNSNTQATSCSITTPTITAPTATPTVVGFNQSASATSSQVGSNAALSVTSSINGKTYYAITRKDAKTVTITFNKNGASTQTNSSGTAVSDTNVTRTCTIAATYNGTAQATTCSVTSPTIVGSTNTPTVVGYSTATGTHTSSWNQKTAKSVSANATYYAQTTKAAKTITITFNKNGAASQTDANGTASTATTVTRSCTIAATYNGTAQATTCSVTSPKIVASSNTPTITGYSTAAGTHSNNWSHNTAKSVSANATYYAQTTKAAVTRSVTYSKGSGVSAIGKTSDSCSIAATYNGTAQASSCNVTLPSITSLAGYNTGFWSTSSSATSGTSASTSVALSSNRTYYARALDTTKPVWSLVSSNPSSGTIGSSSTITITFKGTDTSGSVTPTIAASNITVKAGSTTVSPTTKTLSAATSVTNGKQYTLTLAGIKEDGVVSITIAASTLKDGSGNTNNAATLTTGVTVKSVTISKGNVKGGSITLGVTKASVGETVSFTTSPTSGFTYQGATVVCENGTKTTIASSSKSFTTTSTCKSPTVWPNWKKDDYTVFWTGKTESTGGMGALKYEGTQMSITWNHNNSKALSFNMANAGQTRGQATTGYNYGVDDYATLHAEFWCHTYTNSGFTAFVGLSKDKSQWVHINNQLYTAKSWSNTNARQNLNLDITSSTGIYYISSQMIVDAKSSSGFGCYNDVMQLLGRTYGYGSTGL